MLSAPMTDPAPAGSDLADRTGARVVGYAPARANLIGEHLDYNGGPSLPIALPYWTYVAIRPLPHAGLRLRSTGHATVEDESAATGTRTPRGDWTDYPVGVLRSLRSIPGLPDGMELTVASTVPEGSGLSSSASLSVATAAAVWALASGRPDLPRDELLQAARAAENDFAGAPTGSLDQTALLFARAGRALRFRPSSPLHGYVPWDPALVGAGLLVVDTRVRHALTGGGYAERVAQCRAAADLLGVEHLASLDARAEPWLRVSDPVLARRIRHVVTETRRTELFEDAARAGDLVGAGALMTASHASLRDDYEVSCAELDLAVDTALANGALGARMTGGGFGGCALVLVDTAAFPRMAEAITEVFRGHGRTDPRYLDGTAVGPADVLLRQ